MIGRVMWVTWVVYITILPTVICSDQNNHKISGGNDANKNQFPYIARLRIQINGRIGRCGASLISEKYLTTAAHCFTGKVKPLPSVVKKYFDYNCKNQRNKCVAYIRDHDTTRPDIDEETIDIRRIHLKPRSNIDFLIVELARSVNLDIRANIIPISQFAVKIGQKVITAGWGLVAQNKRATILQTTTLEVTHVGQGIVLTKVNNDDDGVPIDPCGGDSGGPLVIRENNVDKLVGALIGGGYNCETMQTIGDGVWTDVTYHYNWIRKFIHTGRRCDGRTPGQQIKGGNPRGKKTNTEAECTEWCRSTPRCLMWVWHPYGTYARSCRIHGHGWFAERQGQGDVVSGKCA